MTVGQQDQRITGLNDYYFCPEFMAAVAAELGLPRADWNWAE